ncbi:MAG: hypothetical protein H0W86_06490 [Armatimonadetes bacterium]|nr:hypothetical protein [Armatimonadota bacterium]
MKLLIPLFLTLLAMGDELYDAVGAIARDEATSDTAFRYAGRHGENEATHFLHIVSATRENGNRLSLSAYRLATGDGAEGLWISMMPNLRTPSSGNAFSSLPVGTNARAVSGSGSGCDIQVVDGTVVVVSSISYVRSRPSEQTHEDDKIICEGIARRTLARCRGLQAQSAQNININGTPVGSVTGPRGERLVDLVGYCQARGLELTTNQRLGTASFTQDGELVVIPLAALKIKDGPRWIDTRDIALIKDGRWYVSFEGLEATR